MSNFKLIAIPEDTDTEDKQPASIKVTDISGKWLCNILSTGYIVFNSEIDHEIKDIEFYCKIPSMFHTLFNSIKTD